LAAKSAAHPAATTELRETILFTDRDYYADDNNHNPWLFKHSCQPNALHLRDLHAKMPIDKRIFPSITRSSLEVKGLSSKPQGRLAGERLSLVPGLEQC
jgi:hypothetical protein